MDGSVYSDGPMSSEGDRDRVDELEKRVNIQADEIVMLKSLIADLIRRMNELESAAGATNRARPSLGNVNGSTLTLATKASVNRSRPSPTGNQQFPGTTPRPNHHLSTESLQSSSSTLMRGGYQAGAGMRNSPSVDRLGSAGLTARTLTTPAKSSYSQPPASARTTPMRKWTSNSDFQNGSFTSPTSSIPSAGSRTLAPPSTLPSATQRYGSQSQLSSSPQVHSPVSLRPSPIHPEPVFNPDDGYLHVSIRGKGMNFYVPADECTDRTLLTKSNPAPTEQLKLEWAYGYRGRDCRSNLHCLATGECAYFIASVVILVNFQEEQQRHYMGHSDDVRCMAVHPNKFVVASGQTGSSDRRSSKSLTKRAGSSLSNGLDGERVVHVRVWDAVTLQTLHVIGGNGEFDKGFSALAFSKMDGGSLLCVIDESQEHLLSIWDWQKSGSKGDRIAVTACGADPVFACDFHPSIPNFLIACGKAHISFWTLDGSSLSLSRSVGVFERIERPKFLLCLCFNEDGDVLTGDSSGNILSWGRSGNRIRNMVSNAHAGGVFVLFLTSEGQIVSGGKDRRLALWDQGLHKLGPETELPDEHGTARAIAQGPDGLLIVGTNRNCVLQGDVQQGFGVVVQGHSDEVWALASHPNHHQFASASYDRCVTLWNAEDKMALWTSELPDGVHSLCFHPDGDLLAVATISGRWYVLDTTSRQVVLSQAVNDDAQDLLSCIKYSPDGRFLAVASVDRAVYVYQVVEGGGKCMKLGRCLGHSSAVLCLDWSVDGQYLRSNSDNFELIYWNPSTLKQITNAALCRNVEWESCNCILEYGVAGVWSDTVQALSVDCTKNAPQKVLAVGDDGGKVKLFSYPAVSSKSECHVYHGHSNHVSAVRFLHDDSRLITTGGRDSSVLQWTVTTSDAFQNAFA